MNPDHNHVLDELLVLQAQDGDMKAYTILIKRWHPRLVMHAYRMTNDAEVAKDLAQDAWNIIAKGLKKLKSPRAFRSWTYKIVSNKSADWIRLQQRERNVLKEESNNLLAVEESENSNLDTVKVALQELPKDSKLILTMFYLDNHSVGEISNILGISIGTVKSRLFYSRKKLKEKFETLNIER